MSRSSRTSGPIVPSLLSMALLQGVLGAVPSAFGSCPDAEFAPQLALPAGGAAEGIAVADFNGDGDLDLAVTNFSSGGFGTNAVAILLGDGRGAFGEPTRFAVGHGATRIVTSDFDVDGDADVAVLNSNDGTVSILLGDGLGGLGPQTDFPAGGNVGMALGDFNEDGRGDLVVTDIFSARVTILLGSGDGSFSSPTPFPVGDGPLLVAVGDVDGDGRLDVVVDNILEETVSVLPGNGDGTFGPQSIVRLPGGSLPQSLALADLDGDGDLDMVVVDVFDDTVLAYLGRGDGSFEGPAAFQVGRLPIFVAVGDLNGDGRPDLAVGNADDATVSVLLGRGDGTFGPQTGLGVGSQPVPVGVGDFNRDGALDIVAGNFADQTVSVLLNECAGNRPPIADAGADQLLECTGDLRAVARLDGSGSSDDDSTPGTNDDVASFEWSENAAVLARGPAASVPLSLGTHVVSLTVTDRAGAAGSDAARVTVQDTSPPAIVSIAATPGVLSPPNHRFVPVSIAVDAADVCDAAPRCRIDSVTSDEPIPGPSGRFGKPAWFVVEPGPETSPATLTVLLHAARAGTGTGRTYTIGVACEDAAGNESSGRTTVTVAHDRGRPDRQPRSVDPPGGRGRSTAPVSPHSNSF